jgi:UDPglucose 6-dehydrogenase
MAEEIATQENLPIVILGKAFKPESALVDGSPAILLKNILEERGVSVRTYDPMTRPNFGIIFDITNPSVFVIACKHRCFANWKFTNGSVVIDPHRYIPKQWGVRVIHLGEGR